MRIGNIKEEKSTILDGLDCRETDAVFVVLDDHFPGTGMQSTLTFFYCYLGCEIFVIVCLNYILLVPL